MTRKNFAMGLTVSEMEVGNPAKPEVTQKVVFLVDSGAVYSVVPGRIAKKLGVRAIRQRQLRSAGGTKLART